MYFRGNKTKKDNEILKSGRLSIRKSGNLEIQYKREVILICPQPPYTHKRMNWRGGRRERGEIDNYGREWKGEREEIINDII